MQIQFQLLKIRLVQQQQIKGDTLMYKNKGPQLSIKAQQFKKIITSQNSNENSDSEKKTPTAEQVRKDTKLFIATHLKDQPPLPDDVMIETAQLELKNQKVSLRIYRPKTLLNNDSSPALLYHTAGGFVNDMQQAQDLPCALMSIASESVVISIQPPLAPEIKHPKIVEIVDQVTEYIFKNPEEYKIDPTNIGISGYSMGGNLALITTLHAVAKKLPVKCLAIISGQLDLSLAARDNSKYNQGADLDFLAPRDMQVMFINFALPKDVDRKKPEFSPFYADLSQLPPTVVIGGSCDALMPDMRALKDKHSKVKLIELHGLVHNAFFMWHKLGNNSKHMATIIGDELKQQFHLL